MATDVAGTRERILEAAHELVFERGFSATTIDAILDAAGASKGAFFHHFSSKAALGKALIERYAAMDADVLATYMARAESLTSDPAEQLVAFIKGFEDDIARGLITQDGCMFASYLYERIPEEAESGVVIDRAIALWRNRILDKLRQVEATSSEALPVDLESLADQVWTVFEGGFLLARATNDHMKLRDQLAHLRTYLSLVLQVRMDSPLV